MERVGTAETALSPKVRCLVVVRRVSEWVSEDSGVGVDVVLNKELVEDRVSGVGVWQQFEV